MSLCTRNYGNGMERTCNWLDQMIREDLIGNIILSYWNKSMSYSDEYKKEIDCSEGYSMGIINNKIINRIFSLLELKVMLLS